MATAGDHIRAGTAAASSGISDAVASSPAAQALGFNQTAFIFGVIGIAFLIYVTIKGDLPKWLGLLGLAPSSTATPQSTQVQASGSTAGTNVLGSALPDVLSGNYGNTTSNTGSSNIIPFPTLPSIGSGLSLGNNGVTN